MSGASVHHQRGISTAISKAKEYLSCISTAIEYYGESTSGRHSRVDQGGINHDQQSKNISEMNINSNQKLWQTLFWTTRSCRPVRYINRYQQSKSTSGAAENHQLSKAVNQRPSKRNAKAFLDDIAVSTRAVYQPRELYINSNRKRKRTHL